MQVGDLHVREDLHFAVSRRDVVVNDDRMRELTCFSANRLAVDDVIPEELVFGALELALGMFCFRTFRLATIPFDSSA